MRESWAWLADQAGIIGALAALLALWYRIRYDLRIERKQGHEAREALERRMSEAERKMDAHMAEAVPLMRDCRAGQQEAAVTRQKIEGLEQKVERVLDRMDQLISAFLDWKKNGSR